ncbi:BnaC01g39830D [Brassica napus]|uniref:BnaC01g39830D protein n=1 Tax=Brassica napus TaxID=3708 RepID=A0A078GU86_BRANA|nr:BnaC01g39830D [Brassica napus]
MEGENHSMEKGLLLVNKEERTESSETTITPLLIFTTFIIVSASYSFGIALGFTAGTMSSIMEDLDLSIAQFSVFGSLLTFGGMIGAIFSATLADAFGRKMTLWVAEAFFISGWLAIAQAKNIIWLDFGRFFVGTGVGLASYVVPVYIAEITPKNVRGTFTFSNQLLQNCGIATAYYIGNFVSWRTIALIGIIPCLIQFLGLFFVPESPRWLAKENRDEECEVVLQKLRGKEADIVKETREIMISVDATANISMQSLFKRKYARQLIIGVGVMLLQQLCGSSGISYYAGSIFDLAGFPSQTGMTVLSMVVVPKAILGLIIVDRWGRRPLLMASAFGLCLSCISLALAFGFKGVPGIVNFTPTMAFIGILTYVMMFAAGLGALPWIIMSEIFPMDMKVVAGSLVTITNWFTGWIVSYCFNFMLIWSATGTFIIFAIMSGLTVVFACPSSSLPASDLARRRRLCPSPLMPRFKSASLSIAAVVPFISAATAAPFVSDATAALFVSDATAALFVSTITATVSNHLGSSVLLKSTVSYAVRLSGDSRKAMSSGSSAPRIPCRCSSVLRVPWCCGSYSWCVRSVTQGYVFVDPRRKPPPLPSKSFPFHFSTGASKTCAIDETRHCGESFPLDSSGTSWLLVLPSSHKEWISYLLSMKGYTFSVLLLNSGFSFSTGMSSCVAVSTVPEEATEITFGFLVGESWLSTSHYVTIFQLVVKTSASSIQHSMTMPKQLPYSHLFSSEEATHKPASPFLQSLYEGLRGLCPSCRTPQEQKLILSSPPHHNLRVCRVCKSRSDVIDKHDQKVSSGARIACDILKIDHLCKNCYYFKNPE